MAGDEERGEQLGYADDGVEIRAEEVVEVGDIDVEGGDGVIDAGIVDEVVELGSDGVVLGGERMGFQGRD